jgi:hypothetical protein
MDATQTQSQTAPTSHAAPSGGEGIRAYAVRSAGRPLEPCEFVPAPLVRYRAVLTNQ